MLMNFGCASIGIQYKKQSQLTPNLSHLVYVQGAGRNQQSLQSGFKNEGINDNISIMLSAGSGKGNCSFSSVTFRLYYSFADCLASSSYVTYLMSMKTKFNCTV